MNAWDRVKDYLWNEGKPDWLSKFFISEVGLRGGIFVGTSDIQHLKILIHEAV
jgi:hypothetical protein